MLRRLTILGLGLLIALKVMPVDAQQGQRLIDMQIDPAYDTNFRNETWTPVRVTIENNGDDIEGEVVIRPATTRGVLGTFSVPINLPSGSRKSLFVYAIFEPFANQVTVELLNNAGQSIISETNRIAGIQPTDQLYVVITQSASGSIDTTGAHAFGLDARQANWEVESIPERWPALQSINLLIITDADTGDMSEMQKTAIAEWVASGGHLIVTGGTNWQATAAGLSDLLPLLPNNSATIEDLTALARWAGDIESEFVDSTAIATGDLLDDARVILADEDDVPLMVRHSIGLGTVDYLAFDPNTGALRGWDGFNNLWLTLAVTTEPLPNWANGFSLWANAAAAAEILPGINLLPGALPLIGFLVIYIVLVGPVNYVVLNRFNRREFAWVTIPIFIAVFSILAWVAGGRIRGNDAAINRMSLVQSWQDVETAQVTELIGLLSPRRTQYSISMGEDVVLRSLPAVDAINSSGLLSSTFTSSVDIEQDTTFRAADFPVDASFVASFAASGSIPKPDITGAVSMVTRPREADVTDVIGSVRNNTDQVLFDGVILARGQAYRLANPLEPGDVATFDLVLAGQGPPAPARVGFRFGAANSAVASTLFNPFSTNDANLRSVIDILGERAYNFNYLYDSQPQELEAQLNQRRRLFLESLMYDTLVSTGRGNNVYFAAWSEVAPLPIELEGADFNTQETTLYVVELEVEHDRNAGVNVVTSDQFTWSVYEREGFIDPKPLNLNFQGRDGRLAFRYVPLPDARLATVEQLSIEIIYSGGARAFNSRLWNWQTGDWEGISSGSSVYELRAPDRFIGPENDVIIEITSEQFSFSQINAVLIEQTGRY